MRGFADAARIIGGSENADKRKKFSRCRKSFPQGVENFVKNSKKPDVARLFAIFRGVENSMKTADLL